MAKPKNIQELRERVLDAFEQVCIDPHRANQADSVANTAGKVLSSLKLELEYAVMRGEEPDIPFMGPTSGRQIGPSLKSLQREEKKIEGGKS